MESYAKNFVGASLIYFLFAAVIGVGMAALPDWYDYIQIHVHFMLLGWMSMMIFGVGYHILPRFQGHARIPSGWARIHFVLANAGLLAMGAAWWAGNSIPSGTWTRVLAAGGALSVIGFVIFMAIIFRGLVPAQQS